jgi:hypothetical protein
MTYAVRDLGLVFSLVLVSTLTACSLVKSDSHAAAASTTPPTAAYVYVQIQGPQGPVYGFRASSTGHLSAIPGSPFKPAGQIIGATPTKFFTLGKDLIHSYRVASNGAIESQLSQIALFDYSGNECTLPNSSEAGAVLDHTGKYIYVALNCGFANLSRFNTEYQSYLIHSDGAFSYDGDTDSLGSSAYSPVVPSILGNESFAYAEGPYPINRPIGFRRETNGTLDLTQFAETDPAGYSAAEYEVHRPDASPTGNYLVLQLYQGSTGGAHFGSYTVASNGDISTTNTWDDMPVSGNTFTTFSPSGNLFAAYAGGIEIYKFNGASPLTLWTKVLTGTPIEKAAWDRSNHLYATSLTSNRGHSMLFAFTVTPTSVIESSSISIGSPYKMVVVSK